MGKTTLANTFAEFLESPTESLEWKLTEGTDHEFTKVMELHDLSINQNRDLSVQVKHLTPHVKLVKLAKADADSKEDGTRSSSLSSTAAIETTSSKQGKPKSVPGETSDNETSDDETNSRNDNKAGLQLKLVDMGGHSETMLLTAALTKALHRISMLKAKREILILGVSFSNSSTTEEPCGLK